MVSLSLFGSFIVRKVSTIFINGGNQTIDDIIHHTSTVPMNLPYNSILRNLVLQILSQDEKKLLLWSQQVNGNIIAHNLH